MAENESVSESYILPLRSLIKASVSSSRIGIGCGNESEHGIWSCKLTTVFLYAQWRSFQDAIQSRSRFWRCEIDFIEQEYATIAHCQREGTILKRHAVFDHLQMAYKFSKLQPSMSSNLKYRVIETIRYLPDST